ncbi:MAG: hypothetical protein IJI82_01575 [Clostridia bacterium]|nr:hypothetical protein [Clostridia bacterium]
MQKLQKKIIFNGKGPFLQDGRARILSLIPSPPDSFRAEEAHGTCFSSAAQGARAHKRKEPAAKQAERSRRLDKPP